MGVDIQRASMWKRISAWLLDIILLSIVAVALGWLLSLAFGYDSSNQALEEGYARYEQRYGVTFDISGEEYAAMTEEDRQNYDEAYAALIADADVLYYYNLVLNLTMVILTLAILAAYLLLEFGLPLLLGNGQTLGKKVFGICLMSSNGVQLRPVQLFVRAILGKFTLGTMIPVYVILMLFFNTVGLTGTLLLLALVVIQLVSLAVTRNRTALQDMLASTVVVDFASQRIFRSTEELIEYTKRIHAEQARSQSY